MNTLIHRSARAVLAVVCIGCGTVLEGQRTPVWLDSARERSDPALESGYHATRLHMEAEIEVRPNGRVDTITRAATRVNSLDGREFAVLSESYNEKSDRITGLRVWIVHADGSVETFSQKDCSDRASSSFREYGEARNIRFSGRNRVRPGSVFAYEFSLRRQTSFLDHQQYWQGLLPTLYQRLAIEVPRDWVVSSQRINGAVADESRDANRYVWEARSVPPVHIEEANSPSFGSMAARLTLNVHPPEGSDPRNAYNSFRNWNDVAGYAARQNDPQMQPDNAIRRKAAELTANATSEWEQIAAIARFAQSVNYVSIQMDLAQGGGYTAFAAPDVLRRNYGDCKDKTTLMRSLLAAAGIESRAVVVRAGSLQEIDPGWPSLKQFDHMIVAIRVGPDVDAPATLEDPVLGRLLIFDPTDPFTPLGDLIMDLQGSRALVATGDPNARPLIRLPVVDAGRNGVRRHISAALEESGRLDLTLTDRFFGHDARFQRLQRHRFKDTEYTDRARARIVSDMGAVRIAELEVDDLFDEGSFEFRARFSAMAHARAIGNRILTFRPIVLSRHGWTPPPEERINPIEFHPSSFRETVEIALPDGFEVDELPGGADITESFGAYAVSFAVEDRTIRVERSVEINRITLPASDYDRIRAFFTAMATAEQEPVVLVRVP